MSAKEAHTIDDIETVETGDDYHRVIFKNGKKNWLFTVDGPFKPGAHYVFEEEERQKD